MFLWLIKFSGLRFYSRVLTRTIFRVQVFQGSGFSESRFFWVQVFQGAGFSVSRFFRVRVQVLEVAPCFRFFSYHRSKENVKCFFFVCSSVHGLLVKKWLAMKNLSDYDRIRTHNYLIGKQTLNQLAKLAKWLSVRLPTKWLWVWIPLQSLKLQILRLLRERSSLTFRQLQSVDSLWNMNVTWYHTMKYLERDMISYYEIPFEWYVIWLVFGKFFSQPTSYDSIRFCIWRVSHFPYILKP